MIPLNFYKQTLFMKRREKKRSYWNPTIVNLPTHDQPSKKAQHSISNTVVKAVIWPHINTLLVPKTHKRLPPVDA
jgi:hypothetical protein